MNTDTGAKDTKEETDKEKVNKTNKEAGKEAQKEAVDTPVKEAESKIGSAGRSSVPPGQCRGQPGTSQSAFPGTPACQASAVKGSHGRNDNRSEGRIYSFLL